MCTNLEEFHTDTKANLKIFAVFRPFFVQNCEFRFFVHRVLFRDFVRFSSKTNSLGPCSHNIGRLKKRGWAYCPTLQLMRQSHKYWPIEKKRASILAYAT